MLRCDVEFEFMRALQFTIFNFQDMDAFFYIKTLTLPITSVSARSSGGCPTWGMCNDRVSRNSSEYSNYGEMLPPGSTLGVLLDMDKGTISFLRFGTSKFAFID